MRRIAIVIAIAVVAAWLLHSPGAQRSFALPRGTELDYAVTWTSKSDLEVAALHGRVHGSIDLAAHLVLRSYGKVDDAFVVAVTLDRFTRHELAILGSDALADEASVHAAFDGRVATAEIDDTGRIRAVSFRREDPEVFKQVVRTLLADAQVSLADGSTWTAREVTSTGAIDSEYRAVNATEIVRERAAYATLASLGERDDQQLTSHATVSLTNDGYIGSLAADESLRVGSELALDSHLILELVATRAWVATTRLELPERRVTGELVLPADSRKQMLDQRIAGLTVDQMQLDLVELVHTGSLPGGSDWLLRASGLLQEEPGACAELAALFESDDMNARGRAQILDLLAGTGTPAAQDAMRTALSSAAARTDYAKLVQRFSAVQRPTPATFAFVRDAFRNATGDDRLAAAYTLGAIGGHGDADMAKAARDELHAALDAMPEQRNHLVLALGNVGHADDTPIFTRLARDDDDRVRASAAWAMRNLDVRDARRTLVELSADPEPRVAETALRAIANLSLDADDIGALASEVRDGAVPATADTALLAVLAPHARIAAVHDALEHMLAQRADDKPMQARIRAALAR